jgi:hypothetical protein
MAVLTEAIEAERGAGVVRATAVVLGATVTAATTTAPAVIFIVVEDKRVLGPGLRMMIATTALPAESARMKNARVVIVRDAVRAPALAPRPPSSMRMNGINGLFLCSSLPRV